MSQTQPPKLTAVGVGQLWFRYRSFSPLPVVVLMLVLRPDFLLVPLGQALAIVLILLAEVIRIWAVGYAGSVTRTRGNKVFELVTAGPFRYVRNPLYIANILLYVGCCVLFGFLYLSLLAFLYFVAEYTFIVAFEEELLEKSFGEEYRAYKQKVSRWLPSLWPRYAASSHTFHLRAALRSESSTLMVIGVVALLYLFLRVF